jgi:pentatricopeptide repeat protein
MPQHRQLSAILFTDIEGYSATMQQDEQKAVNLRARHREVLQQAHQQFNGRVIQYYGDGTLSIFQSAVSAVQCALSMQQLFCQPPQVPVRMGLHIGDIIFDDEQAMGDGVNLASRIESLGIAGCVLLSDKVNDEIRNHPEFKTVSVGIYQFKNIDRPVEVFALNHEGLIKPKPNSLEGKTVSKKETAPKPASKPVRKIPSKSVAVLPFVNISNDPEQDYFSSGIAEEILNSLSNLKDLKVRGRTSSSRHSNEDIDLREIGEKLGVKTILEGSVRKQGNRLRIMVQLVNVSDGFQLWSEKYDRGMDDIFAIQEEVALAVAEKLKVTLLENDRARINKNPTKNTEAYELYLKGRFYLSRRGDSIMTSMHYFQLSIDLDPGFALAYTGYADACLMATIYGIVPPRQVAYKAKQAAETALKLDPHLTEPYCSLGFYHTIFEWNWTEAEKNFTTCIELNPAYAQTHYWYGLNYLAWIKHDLVAAEKHGRIAVELEPLSSICFGMYGAILHSAGKFNEALAACETGIELDPDSYICYLYKGWCHLAMRQFDEAIQSFSQLVQASREQHFSTNAIVLTYCCMGNMEQARMLYNEMKQKPPGVYTGYASEALATAFLEGVDEALIYFEKAYEERDPVLLTLKYNDVVSPALRQDIRFQSLLERINFP